MKCQLVDKFTYFINKNSSTRIKIKVTTQGEVCDIHFRTNNFSAHSWDLFGCRGKNMDKNIDMLNLHSFVKNNSIISYNKHSTKLILPSPDRSRNWTISWVADGSTKKNIIQPQLVAILNLFFVWVESYMSQ